ncbi:hypothetical protein ABB37_05900 [Leptomonas pyrrhocoris]|uniref:Uncharacterized protein n=1 Tax=Leptomonas pyrrhocoris TaxID=157538 RepID=A0A0M9FZ34_LEPPY|nr:hypothetical protein ABB37_05900 [Leptomonas pyrrhocoris]XP_015657242.1 hypothetical protein ABB37_05900 [Leptomonas pyrrhocoris]XP_015657243.1 hypothetical protein ABB37_05900 [Leptomonas pyrrhocoris]XP_015657244.1 hypothetical protein ABB37_05900 [Leptomonas pyrrhocoris]XP_015657245.1 hypothetical protein ABB37_05900 [Leptomonas pyrrhocoris]KPA78802.1 hypothetical protein ABB37_05900 [Leptomonas pyrrhocoris]KPA78803.1 hypothetical protein ABB37_05900 [Leptomonas pyrrhocoris]KPA78804.1 h|eukprot:XP_015657241.1 hypothetical protein ABB37_05900 [Leptomonas pyrrhocoris]
MNLWLIIVPCFFGVIILVITLVCCLCACSPHRESPEEGTVQVIQVVLYPDGTARNPANDNPADPNHEVRNGGNAKVQIRIFNERSLQYRYYPLHTGEQGPVTAAVEGSAPTRAVEPCMGVVMPGAEDRNDRNTRGAREPITYGEAEYVSCVDGAVPRATSSEK